MSHLSLSLLNRLSQTESNFGRISFQIILWKWSLTRKMSRLMTKTNKIARAPSEDPDQPGHPPSLIRDLLSAWRSVRSLATYWVHSEDSDQTGRMPRLISAFAWRTVILLVLSWGGSNVKKATDCIIIYTLVKRIKHVLKIKQDNLIYLNE